MHLHDVLRKALAQHCQGFSLPKALCVAYSGGVDSSVMLDVAHNVCNQDGIALSAFHVNHGISQHAQQWQAHCQFECESRNIPFFSSAISLSKQPQQSLEAQARDARYRLLDNFAKNTKIVLLAQHEDDQSETFLLQLKRGAGIRGLSSMPVYQQKPGGSAYLRPFLQQSRSSLLEYAQQHCLKWIEDESNMDNRYDRNFLRNNILPELAERWPAIKKTIARSAYHCAQAQQVNNEYMVLLGNTLLDKQNNLIIARFVTLSSATQSSFLRHWLCDGYGMQLTSAMLGQVLRLTDYTQEQPNTDSAFFQSGKYAVERFAGKLSVLDISQLPISGMRVVLDWQNQQEISLNKQLVIRKIEVADATSQLNTHASDQVFSLPLKGVSCVFGGSNLRFKYNANRPSKKLKAWYQEWQISPLKRQQTPVFVHNNVVLAVGLWPVKLSNISCEDEIASVHVEMASTNCP